MNVGRSRSYALPASIIVAGVLIATGLFAGLEGTRTTTSVSVSTTLTTTGFTTTATTVQVQTSTEYSTVTTTESPVTSTITDIAADTDVTTVTSRTISTVTLTDQPFVAPLLQVDLNTTNIAYHGGLDATITLTNLLPYNMSFAPTLIPGSILPNWDQRDEFCGASLLLQLFAFAVFKGHYDSANLSSATQLTMAPPINIECPASIAPGMIVFLPNSSEYAVYYPPNQLSAVNTTMKASTQASTGDCVILPAGYGSCFNGSLFGYWTWNSSDGPPYFNPVDANTTSKYFNYFPPGEYTLVVQDIWGATLYSYFQVATTPS